MLTPSTTNVDAVDAPRAVMWTVSEVAARDGVSKQAVSKKVKALVERHALSVERNGQGHVVRLNVAEYDHLRSRFGDPSKDQRPLFDEPAGRAGSVGLDGGGVGGNGSVDAGSVQPNESYDEALRQKTWHEAEKRRLEVAELKGELVRVPDVTDAVVRCNEAISRVVDRLPSSTDDLAAAVARDGAHGLRVALRKLASRMREEIGDALAALASGKTDEAHEEDRAA